MTDEYNWQSTDLQECPRCFRKTGTLFGDDSTIGQWDGGVCAWCLRHLGVAQILELFRNADLDHSCNLEEWEGDCPECLAAKALRELYRYLYLPVLSPIFQESNRKR